MFRIPKNRKPLTGQILAGRLDRKNIERLESNETTAKPKKITLQFRYDLFTVLSIRNFDQGVS